MKSLLTKGAGVASALTTVAFTFVPESLFEVFPFKLDKLLECLNWFPGFVNEACVITNRIAVYLGAFAIGLLLCLIRPALRRKIMIEGDNYQIEVKYGNLLKQKQCKRVINFDECFTTSVGSKPEDINPESLCGQYLKLNPRLDTAALISAAEIEPRAIRSKHKSRICYESGTLVPNGDDLLMAFAKLQENGRGKMTWDEYLRCLNLLWAEIDKHYGQKDVCIPILGAGTTFFEDGSGASIPQQELLDAIICSYRLNSRKIKKPNKLIIVCKRRDDFSLSKVNQ